MTKKHSRKLDTSLKSDEERDLGDALRRMIVGQEEAVDALVDAYTVFLGGLNPPDRPVANLMFLGPTGCGKTLAMEAMGEALFGTRGAVKKVSCEEFAHGHEVAKLVGSPPGYLGHRETPPFFTQESLAQHHTDKLKLTLVLFDEIEKASDALWNLLLGILDKASLVLGDNRTVSFAQCIITLTGNLGGRQMQALAEGGMGFSGSSVVAGEELDKGVDKVAESEARKRFSPEFMNRIDKVVAFHALRPEHLKKVVEIELGLVQDRILKAPPSQQFVLTYTDGAKALLLEKGTDVKNGARPLKRAIEKMVIRRLARLLSTRQIQMGDLVEVREDGGDLAFVTVGEAILEQAARVARA